jgi:Na+-translocating ferredoxin:NAD+ oxidoreductase RnfC subunit
MGLQCCECSLCDLYACPEDLPPKDMCVRSKVIWRQQTDKPKPLPSTGEAHPLRDSRRVPLSRLVQRLGLQDWDVHAPLTHERLDPVRVRLMLSQHIGTPTLPVVREGDRVTRGQLVGKVPDGKLGAHLHASIDGRVTRVDADSIWLER